MNLLKSYIIIAAIGSSLAACNNSDTKPVAESTATANVSEIVLDNMMTRRSIRKYTDKQVPKEILDKILVCGINAPNGRNQQAYEVKVVTDSASTSYLAENVDGLYKAPVYVFIANKADYDMSLIDVGLLSENIGLSAWSYGIGSINLGSPVRSIKENPELLGKLGFSEGYDLCLALALGYPDETPEAKPRDKGKVQFIEIAGK